MAQDRPEAVPPFAALAALPEWARRAATLVNWLRSRAQLEPVTVANLPLVATQGQRAIVTDANAPTFLATVAGGGAVVCPVFWNGSAWKVG